MASESTLSTIRSSLQVHGYFTPKNVEQEAAAIELARAHPRSYEFVSRVAGHEAFIRAKPRVTTRTRK